MYYHIALGKIEDTAELLTSLFAAAVPSLMTLNSESVMCSLPCPETF